MNLSARLMQAAERGEVLVEQSVRSGSGNVFTWEAMPPMQVKGKSQPVRAFRLMAAADREAFGLREADYAQPMVGREPELAVIIERLELASAGRGQIVGVTGEAGMGKSRLVAEIIRQARERDFVGYGGECHSYGTNASYLVWQPIVRGMFGVDPALPSDEQIATLVARIGEIDPALVERVPLLGTLLNLPIPDNDLTRSFDASLRKASLEALIVDCVRARAGEHPILIVLEDVHWLDPLSRDLIEAVARAVPDVAALVLMVYRPPSADAPTASGLTQLQHFGEVELLVLSDDEITELVHAKLRVLYEEGGVADPELVAQLGARAQGNPFYIEEFLNYLRERGLDPREPDTLGRLALPDSLYSLILGRIDQLTEDQKTALKVASVIGRLFDLAMLTGVYPPFTEREGLQEDLGMLTDLDLTIPDVPEPEMTYLFKHALTQEVSYETLAFATRAMLHDQVGRYLEGRYADLIEQRLDLLAHHYDHSENTSKRREFLRRAGEAAQSAAANVSAISYYQRVLPLMANGERVDVMLRLGQVRELVGEWDEAESSNREALDVAGEIDDSHNRARAQHALGVLDRKRGAYSDAVNWLSSARDSFELVGDASGMSLVVAEIGEAHRLQGRYGEARGYYDQSLEFAGQVPDPVRSQAVRAHSLKGAGTVATWQGDYAAASAFNEESLTIRRALGDKPGVAVLLNNQGIIARFQHDLAEARRLNDESIALLREVGDRWAVGQLLNNQACVAADQGDYAEARALLQESLVIRRQLGDRVGLALSLNTLADVVIDEGDHAAAVPLIDESFAINRELGDQTAISYLLEDYAGVAAAEGRHERALRIGAFAAAQRELIGAPLPPGEAARVERMLAPSRAALDAAAIERVLEEGRRLATAQALDELLALG